MRLISRVSKNDESVWIRAGLSGQPARCLRVRSALAEHTCPCRTLPFSDCRAISAARGSKYCTNP